LRLEPKEEENPVADATDVEFPAADNDESTAKQGPVQEGNECSAEVEVAVIKAVADRATREGEMHTRRDGGK
jgi:hypothetical protein